MTRAAFWRAWSIWAVSVAATATSLVYTAVHPLPANVAGYGGSGANGVVGVVFIGAFATVGALLAWKRPGNPIGWLLAATGLVTAVAVSGVFLAHFPRTLTLAAWLGFLYLLSFGLCVFVVLLFPSGHLPSRRWRPVAWAAGAGVAGWVLGCAFAPTIITVSPATRNPAGVTGLVGASSSSWRWRTQSTWTPSAMTWPVWCRRQWNPPTYRCGPVNPTKAGLHRLRRHRNARHGITQSTSPRPRARTRETHVDLGVIRARCDGRDRPVIRRGRRPGPLTRGSPTRSALMSGPSAQATMRMVRPVRSLPSANGPPGRLRRCREQDWDATEALELGFSSWSG